MPIRFSSVEVIEFPIIAGPNHPSQRYLTVDLKEDLARSVEDEDDAVFDSACITLGWEAQSRTHIDFETFERERRGTLLTKKGKQGKLQRLSRAVKKRILRQNGVATSDIESEDECIARKKGEKKQRKKIRIPGTKAVMKTFRSSQDRFSAQQPRSDSGPGLPTRPGGDFMPNIPDSMPKVPTRCPVSPMPSNRELLDSLEPVRELPTSPLVARPNTPSTSQDYSPVSPVSFDAQNQSQYHISPIKEKSKKKKTVKRHIKGAMVTLAKQPEKLAKQPAKLAKSTRNRFIKRTQAPNFNEEQVEGGSRSKFLPTLPPLYVPGKSSEDEDDLLHEVNESQRDQ